MVDALSLEYVKGATVDFTVEMIGETFEVRAVSRVCPCWRRYFTRELKSSEHVAARRSKTTRTLTASAAAACRLRPPEAPRGAGTTPTYLTLAPCPRSGMFFGDVT